MYEAMTPEERRKQGNTFRDVCVKTTAELDKHYILVFVSMIAGCAALLSSEKVGKYPSGLMLIGIVICAIGTIAVLLKMHYAALFAAAMALHLDPQNAVERQATEANGDLCGHYYGRHKYCQTYLMKNAQIAIATVGASFMWHYINVLFASFAVWLFWIVCVVFGLAIFSLGLYIGQKYPTARINV